MEKTTEKEAKIQIRTDEKAMNDFKVLAKRFTNQGEAFNALMETYKTQEQIDELADYKADLKSFENNLKGLREAYVFAIKAREEIKENTKKEFSLQLDELANVNKVNQELKKELEKTKEELKNNKEKINLSQSQDSLIKKQREEIEKMQKSLEELIDLKARNLELETEIKLKNQEIEFLKQTEKSNKDLINQLTGWRQKES